ncbi:uncharacterized protein FFB20_05098 [Fusarium fujikuroi]|uniref:Uncharacterized protein n=2 Tax=Fusarium fujikuroi TaxID=5127 RepID=S0DNP2_GIBF5|nr:uncharacterized protein FFUJ_01262 [Fusarium fujikuroi IMI 58289]KLO86140.1 uncharacterized protein Y057_14057 [Fusarium fujikuroi]KLP20343.1 uncharacterized protein LW94_10668 [Fusarium fujikuroi]QGI58661.1 hypothetical protein CEK27_000786 [Fusarium fujikuroi]QGI75880.1 hypothetical protein CEK25_000786 [Fusarium fujikuroi]QGI89570.1 hypothetical protein CEK26_000785 [Fusarium fujikuroi]
MYHLWLYYTPASLYNPQHSPTNANFEFAMFDPATITPAEWESLKHDETATEIESINPASSLLSLWDSSRLHKLQEALRSHVPFWMRKKRATGSVSASLGQGEMEQQDGRRLLEAYKKLWPHAINSFAERILTADAIIQFNKGLCMGALWHLTKVFPDALCRPLIFQFCEMASRMTFEDDSSLQSAILDAYEITEGMMGSPFPTVNKVLPLSADTTLYLASARVSYDGLILKSLDNTIESFHLDYPTNEHDTPISSARLISEPAETSNVHMSSELVKNKIQAGAMKMIAPSRSWRDYPSRDNESLPS